MSDVGRTISSHLPNLVSSVPPATTAVPHCRAVQTVLLGFEDGKDIDIYTGRVETSSVDSGRLPSVSLRALISLLITVVAGRIAEVGLRRGVTAGRGFLEGRPVNIVDRGT